MDFLSGYSNFKNIRIQIIIRIRIRIRFEIENRIRIHIRQKKIRIHTVFVSEYPNPLLSEYKSGYGRIISDPFSPLVPPSWFKKKTKNSNIPL
jgi:hypothetical protein